MDNCYVNVMGGLGNQLFQIAAGFAYSKKTGKRLIINPANWNAGQGNHAISYKDTIFKNFEYGIPITRNIVGIHEKQFNYTELPLHIGSVALCGYFQSLKYFSEYKDEFINLLCLPEVKTSFITDGSVAFHIRRGDYLKFPHIYNICDRVYFDKLFTCFTDFQINVFTDSPAHVLDEFSDREFKIIIGNNELEDLTIMSHHPNIVCSNSSFSWWASILGCEKHKIIVPNKWLLDRECSDIYYEGMMKYD